MRETREAHVLDDTAVLSVNCDAQLTALANYAVGNADVPEVPVAFGAELRSGIIAHMSTLLVMVLFSVGGAGRRAALSFQTMTSSPVSM